MPDELGRKVDRVYFDHLLRTVCNSVDASVATKQPAIPLQSARIGSTEQGALARDGVDLENLLSVAWDAVDVAIRGQHTAMPLPVSHPRAPDGFTLARLRCNS